MTNTEGQKLPTEYVVQEWWDLDEHGAFWRVVGDAHTSKVDAIADAQDRHRLGHRVRVVRVRRKVIW